MRSLNLLIPIKVNRKSLKRDKLLEMVSLQNKSKMRNQQKNKKSKNLMKTKSSNERIKKIKLKKWIITKNFILDGKFLINYQFS
jgi:hypothetical protein